MKVLRLLLVGGISALILVLSQVPVNADLWKVTATANNAFGLSDFTMVFEEAADTDVWDTWISWSGVWFGNGAAAVYHDVLSGDLPVFVLGAGTAVMPYADEYWEFPVAEVEVGTPGEEVDDGAQGGGGASPPPVVVPYDKSFWDYEVALVAPVAPVPIPAAIWILGSGLLGLIAIRKKRNE